MKKYLIILLIIVNIYNVFAIEIKVDYVGPRIRFHSLYDINDFYRSWNTSLTEEDKYSCYIDDECIINEIVNYLECKEYSSDDIVCPIAIIYVCIDEVKYFAYEVSLHRMKLSGDDKVYKIPWEFWNLLSEYIPDKILFDNYSNIIFNRNIIGYGGFHYTH
jgi:hypothetical protein